MEASCSEITVGNNSLSKNEIERYSRQILLPEIGIRGQLSLNTAKVLIVGAGGLGCPVGMYLAASGVKYISVVDYDTIDVSNLHRQVLFKEKDVGQSKAQTFAETISNMNSNVECKPYNELLSSRNAISIIEKHDIIIDATDNVATRYLLNDACVLSKKPLVSGSALRFEGQLTIYNYQNGPCYRCLFPNPPPPETVTNCSDGGVLGPVTGVIGSLQAVETMKIIMGLGTTYSQKMLLYNGQDGSFRQIKLRSKQPNCVICGDNPTITELIDYEQFCGAPAQDKTPSLNVLSSNDRITCLEYRDVLKNKIPHTLVDVRSETHVEICKLPNSLNIPISKISRDERIQMLKDIIEDLDRDEDGKKRLYVVCRRGNDSQLAVRELKNKFNDEVIVKDLIGGLFSYSKDVDSNFPIY